MNDNNFFELIKDEELWNNFISENYDKDCSCGDCEYIFKIIKNKPLKNLTLKDLSDFGTGFMALLKDDWMRYLLSQILLLVANDNDGNKLMDVLFYFSSNDALERKKIFSEKQLALIKAFLEYINKNKKNLIERFDYIEYLNGAIENFQ